MDDQDLREQALARLSQRRALVTSMHSYGQKAISEAEVQAEMRRLSDEG